METRKAIKFLNSIAFIFMVLFLILKIEVFLFISLAIILTILISEKITKIIASILVKILLAIGTTNSKILLTIIFYLVLTPIAFLFRLSNRKTVDYFKNRNMVSYFVDINKNYNEEFFQRQW